MPMADPEPIEEEKELELDYSDLNKRAHVEIPAGVDWKSISRSGKTYSELFGHQYEIDLDGGGE